MKIKNIRPVIHCRLGFFISEMLSAAHFSDSTATDFITESLTVEASKKHRTKKAFYCYLDHFFPYNSNEKFTYYDFSKVYQNNKILSNLI